MKRIVPDYTKFTGRRIRIEPGDRFPGHASGSNHRGCLRSLGCR